MLLTAFDNVQATAPTSGYESLVDCIYLTDKVIMLLTFTTNCNLEGGCKSGVHVTS